jgi:hypothetical protein
VHHPGGAPWAGAQALQPGWRLRAVCGIRPAHGVAARIATRGRSQPGCVRARVRPKRRLCVVQPPSLGAGFPLPGLGRAFEIPIRWPGPCRSSSRWPDRGRTATVTGS